MGEREKNEDKWKLETYLKWKMRWDSRKIEEGFWREYASVQNGPELQLIKFGLGVQMDGSFSTL